MIRRYQRGLIIIIWFKKKSLNEITIEPVHSLSQTIKPNMNEPMNLSRIWNVHVTHSERTYNLRDSKKEEATKFVMIKMK